MRFNYDRLPSEEADHSEAQPQQSAQIEMESLSGSLTTAADDQQVPTPAQVLPADAPAVVPTVEEIEAAAPPAAAPSAAAEVAPPKYEDDTTAPPTYGNAVYGNAVADVLYFDNDELLIEGMTVGSWFAFFCAMCGSWLFGVIGFLAILIFSTSHASRDGAWAGFALVLMQLSFYMRNLVLFFYSGEYDQAYDTPADASSDEAVTSDEEFVMSAYVVASYAMLAISWMVLARSVLHYCHIRRAHAAITAAASAAVVAPRTAV